MAIGTIISVAVCVLIWPMSASEKLRSNIDSSLSSTRVLLKLLTKTFLLDADLPEFTANKTLETAIKAHRTSFTALKPALKQAKLEFYNLELQLHANGYDKIVESIERLAQHVGGLRSSCGLQVEVMQQSGRKQNYGAVYPTSENKLEKAAYNVKAGPQRKKMESELKREREVSQEEQKAVTLPTAYLNSTTTTASSTEDSKPEEKKEKEGALEQFIRTVRSPMKSLAYTCKQTIVHLQARFMRKTTQSTPSFAMLRQNLASAIELFEKSQHQALMKFYHRRLRKYHKNTNNGTDNLHSVFLTQQHFPVEDVFLVYFFVFCLLEFAKELMTLVDSVQLVFEHLEEPDSTTLSVVAWVKYLFRKKKSSKLSSHYNYVKE